MTQTKSAESGTQRIRGLPGPERDERCLAQALGDAVEMRWGRKTSSHVSLAIQARKALESVSLACRPDLSHLPHPERLKIVLMDDIERHHVKAAVHAWKSEGVKPLHINRRLVCLSAVGVTVKGNYQRVPKTLKWWLKPDDQAKLITQLTATGDHEFVDYLEWATSTGFRVEESLRLVKGDFTEDHRGRVLVTVPGLKTYDAQATLPLSPPAEAVYRRRLAEADSSTPLFESPYWKLAERWRRYKHIIGAGGVPGATLKSFRRVSARNLHVEKAMPIDLVRQYLRHDNVQTTMSYLRLTGGYSTDEFARYLGKEKRTWHRKKTTKRSLKAAVAGALGFIKRMIGWRAAQ